MKVFVINPGSTSTKLALFEDSHVLAECEHQHDKAQLARFSRVIDQHQFRMAEIRSFIEKSSIDTASIDAVAGRGGLLHPLEGGVYEVSDDMISDLTEARYGEHPCNLGGVLAHELASEWGVPAYIVDPVVTDEMMDVARLTGFPAIERRSLFHALNQRGAARIVAARLGVEYEAGDFIVCHMGGGVSIGAHRQGRVVDVVNALDGEGPFTPERTGGLPVIPVLDLVAQGTMSVDAIKRIIFREGGLFAHLGTNDPREVVARMEGGDAQALLVFKGLAYSVAKHISSLVPALANEAGVVNLGAVVLTGGAARSRELVAEISRLVSYLGTVEVVAGEKEMATLAAGAVWALQNESGIKSYRRCS